MTKHLTAFSVMMAGKFLFVLLILTNFLTAQITRARRPRIGGGSGNVANNSGG